MEIGKKALTLLLSLMLVIGTFASIPGFSEEKAKKDSTVADSNYVSPEQQKLIKDSNSCIRVDINSSKGNYSNTSTPYWQNWVLSGTANNISKCYQDITFTLSDSLGSGVAPGFNKKLIQSSGDTPRKTIDGVTAKGAAGDAIHLKISGLSAGLHTLTAYFSSWDTKPAGSKIGAAMSISKDGTVVAAAIPCPNSIDDDSKAGCAFLSFTAKADEDVTFTIQSMDTTKNAELSAFIVDGPDPSKTISNAKPYEGNFHYDESLGLSWQAGHNAVSHDVYFGTDFNSVNTASTVSDAFQGNQKKTTYKLKGLDPAQIYWWRVDEHNSSGEVIKGEVICFRIRHLAFPSAEGYGRFASGGRGGKICEVTNLKDSGPGSLREALEVDKGPRVVVFRVGGVIALQNRLTIPSDGGDVYVAGQTAPGDGITLINWPFGGYSAKDVIIRDIRLRVGDSNGKSSDGLGMANCDHSIVDHCSISWTTDESISSRGAHNITYQNNLISEALNNSVHYKDGNADRIGTQPHSYAASISGNIGSFYHNLTTNCSGRNFSMAGSVEADCKHFAGYVDVTNNIFYNFRNRTTDGGCRRENFVGNYYKMGPESLRNLPLHPSDPIYLGVNDPGDPFYSGKKQKDTSGVLNSLWIEWTQTGHKLGFFQIDGNEVNYPDMQKAYLNGNKEVDIHGNTIMGTSMEENWANVGKPKGNNTTMADVRSDTPFFPSYVKVQSADNAYKTVLANVGATKPRQDKYDQRYIREVTKGTYTYKGSKDGLKGIIDSQNDVGGYPVFEEVEGPADSDHDGIPDHWEIKHGLNPNSADDARLYTLSAEGYNNLEMYLDEAAGDSLKWVNDNSPHHHHHNDSSDSESTVIAPVTPDATYTSDTTEDFSVADTYLFKITSKDGKVPAFVVGTPGVFNVELVHVTGNDYYFRITAIGPAGSKAGIYINGGPRLLIAMVGVNSSYTKLDTGKKLSVRAGKAYQFKVTASQKPTFVCGNGSVFNVTDAGSKGSDYFFKVTAVGKTGDCAGFYVNGEKTPRTIGTIS